MRQRRAAIESSSTNLSRQNCGAFDEYDDNSRNRSSLIPDIFERAREAFVRLLHKGQSLFLIGPHSVSNSTRKRKHSIIFNFFILLVMILLYVHAWVTQNQNKSFRSNRTTGKERSYTAIRQSSDTYSVFHCPEIPPQGYPREYPILDVLENWNTQNIDAPPETIYQGICVFDLSNISTSITASSSSNGNPHLTMVQRQIRNYQAAEVPFVVRKDPQVRRAVSRWSDPGYLLSQFEGKVFQATLSNTTIMTYYSLNPDYNTIPEHFVSPTRNVPMSYKEWYELATNTTSTTTSTSRVNNNENQSKYAYLRLDACLADKNCDSTYRGNPKLDNADFIYEDLDFFRPEGYQTNNLNTVPQNRQYASPSLYSIDSNKSRGINCRFATPGLTAESHFDNENNYIAMLLGQRRYLLGHPKNCPTMYLYPQKHPLERHTQVDWSNQSGSVNRRHDDDRSRGGAFDAKKANEEYPHFSRTTINEVVLTAGDVLYLPTYWFHHIVSLTELNYQCNTRSGYSVAYDQTIYDCGFFYDFPS